MKPLPSILFLSTDRRNARESYLRAKGLEEKIGAQILHRSLPRSDEQIIEVLHDALVDHHVVVVEPEGDVSELLRILRGDLRGVHFAANQIPLPHFEGYALEQYLKVELRRAISERREFLKKQKNPEH